MKPKTTPEEALGGEPARPLRLELRCTRCDKRSELDVRWAAIGNAATDGGETAWDGVLLSRIFTCPSCGAVDEYEIPPATYAKLTLGLAKRALGIKSGSSGVIKGEARLWDGTRLHRPSHGLAHLRALAEKEPANAEAWRRLGNFCERYELPQDAETAWRKAVAVGPDEFEAAYSLAKDLAQRADPAQVAEGVAFLALAIERFPAAQEISDEKRAGFAAELADMVWSLVDHSAGPLALMAGWSAGTVRGQVVVNVSGVDLRAIARREGLAELLQRRDVVSLQLTNELPDEPSTRLRALIEQGAIEPETPLGMSPERFVPPVPVRVEKHPGRNEPCSCGSGKKYKKCHGA